MAASAAKTGYPLTLFEKIQYEKRTDIRCSREDCNNVLREPMQAECGHRFCKECLDIIKSRPVENHVCDACKEEVMMEDSVNVSESPFYNASRWRLDVTKVFVDKAAAKEVDKMKCKCPNPGCYDQKLQKYTIGKLEQHLLECDFRPIPCSDCGVKVPAMQMSAHQQTICSMRKMPCEYGCGEFYKHSDMTAHRLNCSKAPKPCAFCKMAIRTGSMEDHLKVCTGMCPLGCKDSVGSLADHLSDQTMVSKHLEYLLRVVSSLKDQMPATVAQGQGERTLSPPEQQRLMEQLIVLERRMDDTYKQMEELINKYKADPGQKNASEDLHYLTVFAGKFDNAKNSLQELADLVKVLASDVRLLSSYEKVIRDIEKKADAFQNSMTKQVEKLESDMHRREAQLQDVKLAISAIQQASYDGVFVWKIANVSRERELAIAGTKHSLYSPPFFTSVYGYRMCARIYFNGDGLGKGTHISLFFVVMRGEYDALLPWPFQQKVTMQILDLTPRNQPITEKFKPEISSTSFQRPKGEMNIASGCPKFAQLVDVLDPSKGYIENDTLYVKIIVDTSEINPYYNLTSKQ